MTSLTLVFALLFAAPATEPRTIHSGLTRNREDRNRRIRAWFRIHRPPSP